MERLAEQLIEEFLDEYCLSASYSREHITRLVELATSRDDEVAEPASRAFFRSLVERLADSFEPDAVTLYNRAFAQLIHSCRKDPRARLFDRELARRGLLTEDDLISRAAQLRSVTHIAPEALSKLRRIIVLSRVTLGAEVAITSVIIERIRRDVPDAEVVLLGGRKSFELFGGDPRLRVKEIEYARGGTAILRLSTWVELLKCVRELTTDLNPGEYLIVDPDTRLTQLGVLPVASAASDREYVFFPSREYRSDTSRSLGELTSLWLDEVFGESATTYPRVSLSRSDIDLAKNLIKRVKPPIVAINFGVGDNPFKRVGEDFEASLIWSLLREGASIVLDKGAGQEEGARIDAMLAEAAQIERNGRRARVVQLDGQTPAAPENPRADADVLVWNGRVGILAGLIGQSDLYIGYDSAGQHIAAALQVPCIDVFAGFSSHRMLDRWRPTGIGEIRVLPVETGAVSSTELVSKVMDYAGELLSSPHNNS